MSGSSATSVSIFSGKISCWHGLTETCFGESIGDNEVTYLMASSTDPGVLSTRSSGSSSFVSKGYLKCTFQGGWCNIIIYITVAVRSF